MPYGQEYKTVDGGTGFWIEVPKCASTSMRHARDKYAVGLPAAMEYYLHAFDDAPRLWAAHPESHLIGERLMHAHLAAGPFRWEAFGSAKKPSAHKHSRRKKPSGH